MHADPTYTPLYDPSSDVYGPYGLFGRTKRVEEVRLPMTRSDGVVTFSGLLHVDTGLPHGYGARTVVSTPVLPQDKLLLELTVRFNCSPRIVHALCIHCVVHGELIVECRNVLICGNWINGVPNGRCTERISVTVRRKDQRDDLFSLSSVTKHGQLAQGVFVGTISVTRSTDCASWTESVDDARSGRRDVVSPPCEEMIETVTRGLREFCESCGCAHQQLPGTSPARGLLGLDSKIKKQPLRLNLTTVNTRSENITSARNLIANETLSERANSGAGKAQARTPYGRSDDQSIAKTLSSRTHQDPTSPSSTSLTPHPANGSVKRTAWMRLSEQHSSRRSASRPNHNHEITVGQEVVVFVDRREVRGVVQFIGHSCGRNAFPRGSTIVGVRSHVASPSFHNGTLNGIFYFATDPHHGVIAGIDDVQASATARLPFT